MSSQISGQHIYKHKNPAGSNQTTCIHSLRVPSISSLGRKFGATIQIGSPVSECNSFIAYWSKGFNDEPTSPGCSAKEATPGTTPHQCQGSFKQVNYSQCVQAIISTATFRFTHSKTRPIESHKFISSAGFRPSHWNHPQLQGK